MKVQDARRAVSGLLVMAGVLCLAISMPAQQMVTDTRDSSQQQDEDPEAPPPPKP